MKKIALITGITGQDGPYLADFLLKKNYQVVGITRGFKTESFWRLKELGIQKKITLIKGSLLDEKFINKVLKKYQPTELYNLAGQSSVYASWNKALETSEVNFLAVTVLLEAVHLYSPKTKFFQASTAAIYGETKDVITEKNHDYRPNNPYAIAKLAAHQSVKSYRVQYGIFAVNGILFNHESPLREEYFVSQKIVRGIVGIVSGKIKQFSLGSLDTARDWGYAREYVEAMWLLLQGKKPADAIICTGKTYSVQKFVEAVANYCDLKNWQKFVTFDRGLTRKSEVSVIRGSNKYITKITGWKPRTSFLELIKILVEAERKRI